MDEDKGITPYLSSLYRARRELAKLYKDKPGLCNIPFDGISLAGLQGMRAQKSITDKDISKYFILKNYLDSFDDYQEFYLTRGFTDKYNDRIEKIIEDFRKMTFDMPYKHIIVTNEDVQGQGDYCNVYAIFRQLPTKYVYTHTDGSMHRIYESLFCSRGVGELVRVYFTPILLPRLFMGMCQASVKDCQSRLPKPIMLNGNDSIFSVEKNILCLRNQKTCEFCMEGFNHVNKAAIIYTHQFILAMTLFMKSPERIARANEAIASIRQDQRERAKEAISQGVPVLEQASLYSGSAIVFSEKGYGSVYIKSGDGITRHHGSPCEHWRKPHDRHYKSGKVAKINGTIVNKGHQRKIYKFQG